MKEQETSLWFEARASLGLLHALAQQGMWEIRLDNKRHQVHGHDASGERCFTFCLPLVFPRVGWQEAGIDASGTYSPLPTQESLGSYLQRCGEELPVYLVVLVQAGQCALGLFVEGKPILHKVIRKYMVRKTQGKAQVAYLQKKGKSRVGSRVRLANSLSFFEEINETLSVWWEEQEPTWILTSCSARLWPLWFHSRVAPPFTKEDRRLRKIPQDVRRPTLKELWRMNSFVLTGHLQGHEKREEAWKDFVEWLRGNASMQGCMV